MRIQAAALQLGNGKAPGEGQSGRHHDHETLSVISRLVAGPGGERRAPDRIRLLSLSAQPWVRPRRRIRGWFSRIQWLVSGADGMCGCQSNEASE